MTAAAAIAAVLLVSPAARAQTLTYGEVKLGVLSHDVHFLGGKEHGADINPEVIFASPVSNEWVGTLPAYLSWAFQPRPTVGAELNTAGDTNQFYFGLTWTWQLFSNVLQPEDGITFSIFFGPGFNDGLISTSQPDRKSLGSNVLFREALEIGYRITPVYQISGFFDHVSNAGLAKQNQSINDVGIRLGIRF